MLNTDEEALSLRRAKKYDYFIILPDDKFKTYWDLTITLLLLFVCIAAPTRIAFSDEDEIGWIIIDSVVDTLFFVDIVLNFFFAYHDMEYNLIDDRKTIAKGYMKSWFTIDVISILPINFLLQTGDFNSLARLARLPKLYRLVKMTRYVVGLISCSLTSRLVRMLKIVKERNKLVKYLNEVLKIGVGFERLLFFVLIFFVLCHIVTCFWYCDTSKCALGYFLRDTSTSHQTPGS